MYLPKSDTSDFGTENILENDKPENVKIGYFRRKTVYFRSLVTLFTIFIKIKVNIFVFFLILNVVLLLFLILLIQIHA